MRSLNSRTASSILGAVLLLGGAIQARADTVFDVAGTFTDNTTFSGTLTIDLTTGHVDAANVIYIGTTYTNIYDQKSYEPSGPPKAVGYFVGLGTSGVSFPQLNLLMQGTSAVDSLVAYVGGALCSTSSSCGPDTIGSFYASTYFPSSTTSFVLLGSGELTPTPLPTALPLFATGLGALGLLGWRRKRKTSSRVI